MCGGGELFASVNFREVGSVGRWVVASLHRCVAALRIEFLIGLPARLN